MLSRILLPLTLRSHIVLAAFLAALVIGIGIQKTDPLLDIGDSRGYMSVALDIVDHGMYTDGIYSGLSGQDPNIKIKTPGMFFAPLYPALLSLVMHVDPVFQETARCHVTRLDAVDTCPQDLGAIWIVHGGLAAIALWLVWVIGYLVTYDFRVAWIAMGLSALAEAYAYYTGQIMTENLVFPLMSAMGAASVYGWRKRSLLGWGLAGLFLGLAALTRPSFAYLLVIAIPCACMLGYAAKKDRPHGVWQWPAFFLLAYMLTVAPWVLRNVSQFDRPSISSGYGEFILIQRLAYNEMRSDEILPFFIYSLPDFGDSLAEDIFGKARIDRFGFTSENSFYQTGNDRARTPPIPSLSEQITDNLLPNLGAHIVTTLALAWRGMWVSKYWGLVAIPLFLGLLPFAVRRYKDWIPFWIAAVPPWFMLGFHGFTSVNVVRYNLILIPILAVGTAIWIAWGLKRLPTRKPQESRQA